MNSFARIAVIGAGAWGTALAMVARRAGRDVTLIARRPEAARALSGSHHHPALPESPIDPAITVTADPAAADSDLVILATPAQSLREALTTQFGRLRCPLVICAKGIEQGTLRLMHQVAAELAPAAPVAVLSGPTFAGEVARGLPTAVTIAAREGDLAARVAATLATPTFRPYASDDPVGVEVAGAAKNVIAIACGLVEGRGLGDNARAALMTRGLAEITRLAVALGGRAETLLGLAGVGDLTLTCNNTASRNLRFGIALGAGRAIDEARAEISGVIEGIASADAIADLAGRRGVAMPIVNAVDAILHHHADIGATIQSLLARPLTQENP